MFGLAFGAKTRMTPEGAANTIETVWSRPWPWSIWLTVAMALVLVAGVVFLYWHERGYSSRVKRGFMATCRITAIGLIVWMLAGWTIERYQSDKPELVLLLDTSASMLTSDGAASSARQQQTRWDVAGSILRRAVTSDRERAEALFRPKFLVIDEESRLLANRWPDLEPALAGAKPEGLHSRLGDCLIEVLQRQSGRPTAAVVLISDGIVTDGAPLEESLSIARRLNVPIICIATGQQLPQPDLALVDLLMDEAVYLGDRVNLQVTVAATDIATHRATVSLRDMQSGQVVDSTQVELAANRSTSTVQLGFVPKSTGSLAIKLEVAAAPGEKNLENNSLERVIEVRDQSLRVLLVQRAPSFEYRFLKTLLERTSNQADPNKSAFELNVVLQDADAEHISQDKQALRLVPGDKETIAKYDVILLGQLDPTLVASSTQQLIVEQVTTQGCGLMFICHPDFDPSQLATWPLGKLLPIDSSAAGMGLRTSSKWQADGTIARWQPTTLGKTALPLQLVEPAGMDELWRSLPGPNWYYVTRGLKEGSQVLASANLDKSAPSTASPLLVSQFVGAGRVVLQTNDETYRWIGYRGSELMYERYWIQMLRWLSRGKLNRQAQTELAVEPRQSTVGQPIQFSVKLNTEASAAIKDEFCKVTLEQVGGENKVLELKRTQAAAPEYKSTETNLPAGSYRAVLSQPQDSSATSVTFTVTAPPGEQANLRSDWRGLQSLAEQSHGKFFTAANAENWVRELPKGTSVRRGSLPPLPLWNSPWVAVLIVCLLTGEWILRRTSNML